MHTTKSKAQRIVKDLENIDAERLIESVYSSGLKESESLVRLSQEISNCNIGDEAAGKVAGLLLLESIRISTCDKFSNCVYKLSENMYNGKSSPLVSSDFVDFVKSNTELLDALAEKYAHYDEELSCFGLSTLERAYLLKDSKGICERPVYMYLRVASAICQYNIETVETLFDVICTRKATFATPVMFNSGCSKNPNLASCFLYAITNKKDSVDGLFCALKDCANISHMSGGIGLSLHDIRSRGSPINGGSGTANGVMTSMQLFNTMAKHIEQGGGKRRGAIAVYLEPHHPDIVTFLEARMTYGNHEMRTHDLFIAIWVSDLFMKRVEENKDWSFFDPHLCPGLSSCHGEDYENLYKKYEEEGRASSTMKAQELFYKIVDVQMNASMPYLLFKDHCNKKSNQQNLGTIRSSNLCAEIIQYSDDDETAVCNLCSVCLPKFIRSNEDQPNFCEEPKPGTRNWLFQHYDFQELYEVTLKMATALDSLIDVSYYPIESAKKSNKRHRPIGVGTQGLADCFMRLGLTWGSDTAKLFDEVAHATVYYACLEASANLAATKGSYDTFDGSPASKGILQFDLWDKTPCEIEQYINKSWKQLKEKITTHGLRNSLSVALMPTASTAQIAGNSECIEPYTAMLFTRGTLSGEHVVTNNVLRDTLKSRDSWNKETIESIISKQGSVQHLPMLTTEEKEVFKTAWEIKQKDILLHAAARGKYVCQSMSLNIHMREPTRQKMAGLHFTSWKLGLKTSSYYIRLNSPSSAIQFALDAKTDPHAAVSTCESCSA